MGRKDNNGSAVFVATFRLFRRELLDASAIIKCILPKFEETASTTSGANSASTQRLLLLPNHSRCATRELSSLIRGSSLHRSRPASQKRHTTWRRRKENDEVGTHKHSI